MNRRSFLQKIGLGSVAMAGVALAEMAAHPSPIEAARRGSGGVPAPTPTPIVCPEGQIANSGICRCEHTFKPPCNGMCCTGDEKCCLDTICCPDQSLCYRNNQTGEPACLLYSDI